MDRTERIAALNDQLRRGHSRGKVVICHRIAVEGATPNRAAATLAQGSSTANGIGVLWDGDGWGRDHMARGLPGLAFLLGTDDADVFIPASGPRNREPAQPDPTGVHACPAWPTDAAPAADWLGAVRGSWPGNGSGQAELAAAAQFAVARPDNLDVMLAANPSSGPCRRSPAAQGRHARPCAGAGRPP